MEEYTMVMDGKITKVKDSVLKARGMREKKVEVEIEGRIIKISAHMVDELACFGATARKRVIKNPPKEILNIKELTLPHKEILPPRVETKTYAPIKKIVVEEIPVEEPIVEKPKRKTPVRSKSTKK